MIQGFNYLDFFRSLSFGGLVGAGIAGIFYLKFPYLQTLTSLPVFMTYGGVAGAGAQRAVEAVVNFILSPIGRFISFYEQLFELDFLLWWKKVDDEEYKTLNKKLIETRFLGSTLPDKQETPAKLELPPKP